MTDSSLLVRFLIISPLLIVSLVLHELAHGWVAYLLGDPTAKAHGRLTLNPIKHLDTWGTIMLAVTFLGSGGSSSSARPSRCRSTRASSRTASAAWPGWAPPGR